MKGHIAHVQEVVSEILLDHIAFVATADHKLIDAVGAKDLEDVPEDRLAADFHHGLGLEVGFFADAGAKATGEDYGFLWSGKPARVLSDSTKECSFRRFMLYLSTT